jgi:hypothetical protein
MHAPRTDWDLLGWVAVNVNVNVNVNELRLGFSNTTREGLPAALENNAPQPTTSIAYERVLQPASFPAGGP